MSANVRALKRRAAPAPAPRTLTVTIPEGVRYEGWSATFRQDFPARLVLDLESGKLGLVLEALERIIVEHNLPDSDGNIAEHLADVDPYDGLVAIANAVTEALAAVPPR